MLAHFVLGAFGTIPTAAPAVSFGVVAATAQVALRVQRGPNSQGFWWPPGLVTGTVLTHIFMNRVYRWAEITARTATQKPSVQPAVVLVFSGKRKSGKDYITELLNEKIGREAAIFRLSGPLKEQYALDHGLDLQELLSASAYKEKYRQKMIVWGEEKRNQDPGYFARLATEKAVEPIWIISDARRPTDIAYFQHRYPTISVRVEASDATRAARGWIHTRGVDDVESECGLDGREWDFVINNNGDAEALNQALDTLLQLVMLQARSKDGEPILTRTLSAMRKITPTM
eukprot:m.29528 g.29528  ORF g.29528 m.29528 type:complete len:287 (-) comp6704_c0_seq2:960-1820(-)